MPSDPYSMLEGQYEELHERLRQLKQGRCPDCNGLESQIKHLQKQLLDKERCCRELEQRLQHIKATVEACTDFS